MENAGMAWWSLGWAVVGALVLAWLWRTAEWVYWTPRRLERALRAQGLRGTPYRLLIGDAFEDSRLAKDARSRPLPPFSHSILPRVLPFLHDSITQYDPENQDDQSHSEQEDEIFEEIPDKDDAENITEQNAEEKKDSNVTNTGVKDSGFSYKDALTKGKSSKEVTFSPPDIQMQGCSSDIKDGKISFTWLGSVPRVSITDPELVKEVLSSKFSYHQKQKQNGNFGLLISGLLRYEGEKWAKHRRIINPAFHVEKLKSMLPAFSDCCEELIGRWESYLASKGSYELDVWPEIQNFTGDVISRAAFGSSYAHGRRICQLQSEQAQLLIQSNKHMFIPGYRFLPTPKNIRIKEIYREIRAILESMIEKRKRSIPMGESSDDLLGLLMESNSKQYEEQGNTKQNGMTTEEVIEECKLFYFAGQETNASLLTWMMILLSMYPLWQSRAREEILQVFGKNKLDFDGLSRLKVVPMILYEVFRLYPPFILLFRELNKTMELGGITLPAGVVLNLPIIFIHHDPDIWGEDVYQFKPERFADGVSKASKNQMSLLPFGWGPKICVGQNFAMLEAKMCLCSILQHFSFELSPSYIHAPQSIITLQPQHGAQIILRRLEDVPKIQPLAVSV